MTDPAYPDALPTQSRLHWYVIERVLGQGGFGITYLARDPNLEQRVAIKEYLPVEFATRMPDGTIRSRTEELRDRYRWGLERFLQEAQTLARFDHRSIVRVHSVFEFNNTAYMVMRFEEGINLAALLDRRGTLPEDELLAILLPVLDGLELVHRAGFIHRDIKPDNIHIGVDGRPVLLDFGSARQALGAAHTLTILVAPGYAPFEQYYSDSGNQGPWTDIYGLGATCYRAIAGRSPLDAVMRSKGILGSTQDVLVSAKVVGAGRYSDRLLAAIDHALEFAEKDRPQTIAQWRQELTGSPSVEPSGAAVTAQSPGLARTTNRSNDAAATAVRLPPARTRAAEVVPAALPETSRGWSAARIAIAFGVAILAVGIGVYLVAASRTDDAWSRIAALEKQVQDQELAEKARLRTEQQKQEQDLADAARLRLAQQKADDEARQRREREPQVQVVPDKMRADENAKRVATERSPPDGTRVADRKRTDVPARPSSPAAGNVPVAVPSTSSPQASQAVEPAAVQMAAAAPPPAVPAPAKAAATRTPAEQFADADQAWEARRYPEAIALLRPMADTGNARAQTRLGDAYLDGRGLARDDAAAGAWYEKAALQGDTSAQVKLAALYASGNGALRNINLAYVWFGTAARLGSGAARIEQERVAASLQPAERAQADRLIESSVARMSKGR